MARPRVFISSTFYDLQHVRNDLDVFVREMGYEPVMFEHGGVPWSQEKLLEDSCYAEITRCDILVSVIGDRLGSASADGEATISQNELKKALDDRKQVYVFLWHVVDAAQRIYALNKDRDPQPDYGMDVRILKFVDTVRALPTTGIVTFTAAQQITNYLRDQWAGLFQELLANRQQVQQQAMLNRVSDLAKEMAGALDSLTKDRWNAAIMHHPGIEQVRKLLNLDHRAYVATKAEFADWMGSMGMTAGGTDDKDFIVFTGDVATVRILERAFFTKNEALTWPPKRWDEGNVIVEWKPKQTNHDDDIPF